MDNSRLKITVDGIAYYVDLGYIQSTTNAYSPQITSQGIPSVPSQNTFVMDTGVVRVITQSYVRVPNSRDPNDEGNADTTKWPNGYWIKFVKRYIVNRWQSSTDGCVFSFDAGEMDYPEITDTNVYVDSFTHTYVPGAISGMVRMKVGSHKKPKAVAQHVIIYHINIEGNSTNMAFISNSSSTPAKAIPPTWIQTAGMQFKGWDTDPNKVEGTYSPGQDIPLSASELNLYAIWGSNA